MPDATTTMETLSEITRMLSKRTSYDFWTTSTGIIVIMLSKQERVQIGICEGSILLVHMFFCKDEPEAYSVFNRLSHSLSPNHKLLLDKRTVIVHDSTTYNPTFLNNLSSFIKTTSLN